MVPLTSMFFSDCGIFACLRTAFRVRKLLKRLNLNGESKFNFGIKFVDKGHFFANDTGEMLSQR